MTWQTVYNLALDLMAGRELGFGVVVGETTTDVTADILWLDYIRTEINRPLTR